MKMRCASLIATALLTAGIASALTVSLVGSRSALSPTDSIDWSTQGSEFDVKTGGSTVGATNFTLTGATTFTLLSGSTYNADFLATDTVLAAADLAGAGSITGPIRITFASAVRGAGAQLQISSLGTPFTGMLEAFDSSNASLGSVTLANLAVNNPSLGDGSAPFIGIQSDLVNIFAVEFSTGNDGTAINNVAISTTPPMSGLPEPSSWILFSAGMLGLLRFGRKSRRQV